MAFSFYSTNLINTSSSLWFSTGSGTATNLFDRKESLKWTSVSENTDGNTATMSWVFASATAISNIMLINHNFEAFNIIYNSNTANQFSPALSVTANVNSNTFYEFTTTTVSSIDINCWNTIAANTEKTCGQLIVSKGLQSSLNANPTHSSYKPIKRNIGIQRELIDGGMINIRTSNKFSAELDISFINTATFINLNTIWDNNKPIIFVPFPDTFTASWEGTAKTVIWLEDFNVGQFRLNKLTGGYMGSVKIAEVPN